MHEGSCMTSTNDQKYCPMCVGLPSHCVEACLVLGARPSFADHVEASCWACPTVNGARCTAFIRRTEEREVPDREPAYRIEL